MDWDTLLDTIGRELGDRPLPSVSEISREGDDPFHVLISTLISLRTRDEVTLASSRALFAVYPDVDSLAEADEKHVSQLIYPAGFYRTKAKNIGTICRIIRDDHGGAVPSDIDGLIALPGVGRKTANLVLGLGFGVPAICVDTHVHRIPNRMGLINTKKPEETETALQALVPRHSWIRLNEILVSFGQVICAPSSPWCSRCPFRGWCPKVGVDRRR